MSFITGVGLTAYGRHEGSSSLDLMSKAAELAIADAGLKRNEIDGIQVSVQYPTDGKTPTLRDPKTQADFRQAALDTI